MQTEKNRSTAVHSINPELVELQSMNIKDNLLKDDTGRYSRELSRYVILGVKS